MQEHARMMAAFSAVQASGGVCVLVTVVGTRGSSYRSPGARMLILPDGSRIGAVSGGCLEGELCRRAHWWTSESPAVLKTFDTSTQEDNEGFGLGCGGGIDLLLERLPSEPIATHPLLAQERVTESREAAALAMVLEAVIGLRGKVRSSIRRWLRCSTVRRRLAIRSRRSCVRVRWRVPGCSSRR
jgi:xanthine/CO dehydrogenase XdhC/CoxF family maturation factor